jgi:hypothetical protein
MPRLPLVFSCLLALLAGCAPTHSSLTLAPGERFELGGPGDGAFRVELTNEGDVPVSVAEQRSGELVPLAELAPGETQTVRFEAGSAAVLTNTSGGEARIAAEIRGGALTMRATGGD